jgi:hypothetical protein
MEKRRTWRMEHLRFEQPRVLGMEARDLVDVIYILDELLLIQCHLSFQHPVLSAD